MHLYLVISTVCCIGLRYFGTELASSRRAGLAIKGAHVTRLSVHGGSGRYRRLGLLFLPKWLGRSKEQTESNSGRRVSAAALLIATFKPSGPKVLESAVHRQIPQVAGGRLHRLIAPKGGPMAQRWTLSNIFTDSTNGRVPSHVLTPSHTTPIAVICSDDGQHPLPRLVWVCLWRYS